METTSQDWTCPGWGDQERAQLEAGAALSFREKMLWLQDADRLVARLEKERPWIDEQGIVHPARRD